MRFPRGLVHLEGTCISTLPLIVAGRHSCGHAWQGCASGTWTAGALVEQLEALVRSGREMILVTSGAVSVGRQKLRQQQILNSSPLEMQISGPSTVCSELVQMVLPANLLCMHRLPR